jgi:hypothetical protein
MTEAYAYAFKSDLTPGAIVARFRELGPWEWDDRDSDSWGPYYSAGVLSPPDHGIVKLIAETDHYVLNVVLRSSAQPVGSRFDDVRDILLDRLLPAIGARDIAETDLYE